MKFICPSCKAKYQISDEKVAEHAVRMKCRKCARIIRITKQGAELSESSRPRETPGPARASSPGAPARSTGGLKPPPRPTGATAVPGARRSAPHAAGLPPAPRPSAGAAPRPSPSAPSRPAVVPRVSASSASAPNASARSEQKRPGSSPQAASPVAKVPVPRTSSPSAAAKPGPVHTAAAKPGQPAAAAPEAAAPARRPAASPAAVAPGSALAGAFSAAVQAPSSELEVSAGDEWFVGINGVPVGPIKLTELRAKAAAGAVTKDSLVWRDGFEEWKPLGTYPELVAIVEEGSSSGRASFEPFAAPEDATVVSQTVPRTELQPVQSPQVEQSPAVVDNMAELEELAGLKRKGGPSVPQVFAMAVAILFGLTVGFVIFSGSSETKEVVKYVKVPAESDGKAKAKIPAESDSKTDSKSEEEEQESATQGAKTQKVTKATPAKAEQKGGLKGLSGLSGLATGPSNGPVGNQATKSTSGKPLDSAAVQSTVRRYTASVKRSCWQPALDTRDSNAPTSARVAVTITVAGSGAVQSVSTSGDPHGYRGLASCIARRVRTWQFPASSGTTTVNVPFVFAAQ